MNLKEFLELLEKEGQGFDSQPENDIILINDDDCQDLENQEN